MKEEPAAVLRGMELKASYKPVAIFCEFFLFSPCVRINVFLYLQCSHSIFCTMSFHYEDKEHEVKVKNLKCGITDFH